MVQELSRRLRGRVDDVYFGRVRLLLQEVEVGGVGIGGRRRGSVGMVGERVFLQMGGKRGKL